MSESNEDFKKRSRCEIIQRKFELHKDNKSNDGLNPQSKSCPKIFSLRNFDEIKEYKPKFEKMEKFMRKKDDEQVLKIV